MPEPRGSRSTSPKSPNQHHPTHQPDSFPAMFSTPRWPIDCRLPPAGHAKGFDVASTSGQDFILANPRPIGTIGSYSFTLPQSADLVNGEKDRAPSRPLARRPWISSREAERASAPVRHELAVLDQAPS